MSIATTIRKCDSIAIGGFDGMHAGHQHLFDALGERGCVVVIDSGYANLTPKKEREYFTAHPFVYLYLEEIRHLDAAGFIALLEKQFPKLKRIVIGYDFHFGKDRKYGIKDLKRLFRGEVQVIDEVKIDGESVHSCTIREKIAQGDIKKASLLLGHNYSIYGKLIHGQGIGKKEIVATINLQVEDYLLPKEGVYVTLTRLDDEEHFHPSVSFIGHRATTDGTFAVETHILDGEVLCQEGATISFIDFLRDNEKFATLEALKSQIAKDIHKAKQTLKMLAL